MECITFKAMEEQRKCDNSTRRKENNAWGEQEVKNPTHIVNIKNKTKRCK